MKSLQAVGKAPQGPSLRLQNKRPLGPQKVSHGERNTSDVGKIRRRSGGDGSDTVRASCGGGRFLSMVKALLEQLIWYPNPGSVQNTSQIGN